MHVLVGKGLGAHVVEVVGVLQHPPGADVLLILRVLDLLPERFDKRKGVPLHFVPKPCGSVPLHVSPGSDLRNINVVARGKPFHQLGRRCKPEIRVLDYFAWHVPQELEYARVLPVVLAECFVVHEYVHAVAAKRREPARVLVSSERMLAPPLCGKAVAHVVGKPVVAQQRLYLFAALH